MRNKKIFNRSVSVNSDSQGFTLIELLVVIAIIALLASIALIALTQARQKSRDAKRLGDMTQMNTGLELYFAANKGYPASATGTPQNLTPYVTTIPLAPVPADGACLGATHSSDLCTVGDPVCTGTSLNSYYYVASGTPATINGVTVYPDYAYFFCLGNQTGNFPPGAHILTPQGVK